MIKLQALEDFNLERYSELKNIERVRIDTKGKLYKGDKFECEKELADYLLGNNPLKRPVVKIVEVEPKLTHGDKIKENIVILDEENVKKAVKELKKHIKKNKKKA